MRSVTCQAASSTRDPEEAAANAIDLRWIIRGGSGIVAPLPLQQRTSLLLCCCWAIGMGPLSGWLNRQAETNRLKCVVRTSLRGLPFGAAGGHHRSGLMPSKAWRSFQRARTFKTKPFSRQPRH